MDFNNFLSLLFITFLSLFALTMVIRGIFSMFYYSTKEDFEVGIDFRKYD